MLDHVVAHHEIEDLIGEAQPIPEIVDEKTLGEMGPFLTTQTDILRNRIQSVGVETVRTEKMEIPGSRSTARIQTFGAFGKQIHEGRQEIGVTMEAGIRTGNVLATLIVDLRVSPAVGTIEGLGIGDGVE